MGQGDIAGHESILCKFWDQTSPNLAHRGMGGNVILIRRLLAHERMIPKKVAPHLYTVYKNRYKETIKGRFASLRARLPFGGLFCFPALF